MRQEVQVLVHLTSILFTTFFRIYLKGRSITQKRRTKSKIKRVEWYDLRHLGSVPRRYKRARAGNKE